MVARESSAFVLGLEGVVTIRTRLSKVDGAAGRLVIAGFPVEEIAESAAFEEVLHLLWYEALPDAGRLAAFRDDLASRRRLSEITMDVLKDSAAERTMPMDVLRKAAGTFDLGSFKKGGGRRTGESPEGASEEDFEQAMTLISRLPTAVAAYQRLLGGEEPVEPDPELSHAANYLYMLTSEQPTREQSQALESST